MFPRISTMLRLAAAPVLVIAACLAAPVLASNEEYLVQQVCLDSGGNVTNSDPYSCSMTRHLEPGEPLPYHKTEYDTTPSNTSDMLQVSDSFPINGSSIAVQTMFNLNDSTYGSIDPRWPNDMVHFNPKHGGFNILGADGSYLYIRGTFDQTGGWQPWWTSSCAAKGWLLAPSTTITSAGSTSVATERYPECPGTVPVVSASVEWSVPASFTYATGKQITSIISTHIAPSGGQLELVYLTRIYGVTRWERWLRTSDGGPTIDLIKARCPNVSYTKTLNSISYYMADCRDWSSIKPLTTFWDPDGRAPNDANVLTWPVDPLYTTVNWLKNTHIGGPYTSNSNPLDVGCIVNHWDRVNSPAVVNWAFDSGSTDIPPFHTPATSENCTLHFSTPSSGGGGQALYQVQMITPGGGGSLSFGAMLWAPDYTSGTKPGVLVRLFQRNSSGGLISYSDINAEMTNQPATYAGSATLHPNTASVTLAFYPLAHNVDYRITGAWVAPEVVSPLDPLPDVCYDGSGQLMVCP
jgi:hypothetical protein